MTAERASEEKKAEVWKLRKCSEEGRLVRCEEEREGGGGTGGEERTG